MKHKLKEHIDIVFADTERRAPGNRQVAELKEEILQNLYEKYDDLIAKGKTPASAYNIAVAGVGDISELLDSVSGHAEATTHKEKGKGNICADTARPLTPEEQEIARKYKSRSAVLTSVAVALYILCWVPLAILGALLDDLGGFIGLPIMFIMIACATAMMVYNGLTKPKFDGNTAWDKDDDDDDDDDDDSDSDSDRCHGHAPDRPRRSPVYGAISGALWVLTIGGYFLVSYVTGAWHITWLIFLIATALDNVIKAIFDLRR
jgi:hypothetical protein